MGDYPTNEDLDRIANWELKTYQDYVALAEFICVIWHWEDVYASLKGKKEKTLRLATGGWSGNEDIIRALDKNVMFRMVCWQSSHRGGLHIYKIPFIKSKS
jgi:hypothetical protein